MQPVYKIVLVGNSGVGKTCIVRKATTGLFDSESETTLGASYTGKTVQVGEEEIKLQIWDTAGQEKYRSMAPMYYREAHLALIIYSVIDEDSFQSIDFWIKSLQEHGDSNMHFFIVANKIDIPNRIISTEDGKEKASIFGAKYCEVSALTGAGINDLFDDISDFCISQPQKILQDDYTDSSVEQSSSSSCC